MTLRKLCPNSPFSISHQIRSISSLATVPYLVLALLLAFPEQSFGASENEVHCSKKDWEKAKIYHNYSNPEEVYNFGEKIKQLIRDKDIEGIFSLVDGELSFGPRKRFVRWKKFDEIFPTRWSKSVLSSKAPCSPSILHDPKLLKILGDPLPEGSLEARGFMLGDGEILFNRINNKWVIFMIRGAKEQSFASSKLSFGWKMREGWVPPQCFVTEWLSSDNYEEFEDQFNIPKEDCSTSSQSSYTFCKSEKFRKNPGLFLGKVIDSLDPIVPDIGKYPLVLATPVASCFNGSAISGRILEERDTAAKVYKDNIGSRICDSEIGCTQYFYRVLHRVSEQKCHELAPNLSGQCKESYVIELGDHSGGSMGWYVTYNIYGLFVLPDEEKFIVPLKHFSDRKDAFNYIETLPLL